jgi:type VI secretion system secreted protein VgrG
MSLHENTRTGNLNSPLRQDTRIGQLDTPLGKDVLALARFDGTEGISELLEYRIEALSEQAGINFDGAIGDHCTVTLESYGNKRYFDGILVEAQWIGVRESFAAYRLVLRPWLWLLSRTAKCKIFEKKDVKEIITEVFRDYTSDFKDTTTETYEKLEYTVQYRETDLAFVCRLMELWGIYYYFKHEKGKHTLYLADSKSHEPIPGVEKLLFTPNMDETHRDCEIISHWTAERRHRSGKVMLKAYDYLKPTADLTAQEQANSRYKHSKLELYDYPHKYVKRSVGEKFAKVRLQSEQCLDDRRHAAGAAGSLNPGGLFTLERHPDDSQNKQYLVVRASHTFVTEHYRSGASAISDQAYYGNYEVQLADTPFRAPIVTPKALVDGPQTAVVVGKDGEEIDVDEHGRILVHFHWERDGLKSRRVRVAQMWSYKQWGWQYIPRVGMEVIVVYEEGDPDYPLVIGTVYNGDNKHPYDPENHKTQSGMKSNSSKGGNGYNEWMIEDLKGEELIRMHAEKDHRVIIRNSEKTNIGEIFLPPKGSPSRDTTIEKGDDNLTLQTGDQSITISLGKKTTTALISQTLQVVASSVVITPASITITAPTINLTAMTVINLTAPIINLNGIVNINGALNVNGPTLIAGMVPVTVPA